jgi:tagatose-1,6-bisphosphate aldolase
MEGRIAAGYDAEMMKGSNGWLTGRSTHRSRVWEGDDSNMTLMKILQRGMPRIADARDLFVAYPP